VRLSPRNARAYFNLANTLDELGDSEEALINYQKVVTINPLYSDAHYNLALVLQKQGKHTAAPKHWQKYAKLDPSGRWHDYAVANVKEILQGTGLRLVCSNPNPQRTSKRAVLEVVSKSS
jgi:tetratricopeptide (TPR) repeat protein